MSFAAPGSLLAALAAVLVALVPLLRRRPGAVDPLPAVLHGFVAGGRVRLGRAVPGRPWRLALAALLLAVAIGRPQWGAGTASDAVRPQVIIALDLSNSMTATDTRPSRIVRARSAAAQIVAQAPTAEIGLIGFAGRAFLLAPPSADRALLSRFLPAVHPDQMLVPGSDFAALLALAQDSFGPGAAPRTLVLLSDGEAEATPWRGLVPRLKARGIRVVGVGFGTPAGSLVRRDGRVLVDAAGDPVRARLEPDALKDLAAATGGRYLAADAAGGLEAQVTTLAAPTSPAQTGAARVDRFAWFLAPALLLLGWSALTEWPAVPRRRGRAGAPGAALAGVVLTLLVTGTPGIAVKPPAEPDPLRDVKRRVAAMLETSPSAADYMALATATAAYGGAHRQHLHPLRRGALQDGLAAIDAGMALEPQRPGWAPLRARLTRLLRPPRRTDDPEDGDGGSDGATPADDQTPAKEPGFDPNGQPPDTRQVGGTQRRPDEAAQWQVPSLVKPAFTLEKLRATDRPGTLFKALQAQDARPPRKAGQTW